MNPIRVMLVDDHAVMRRGLASLLATCPELEVVGDAGDGETALKRADALHPDLVIMDLLMPRMDGAETTRRLRTRHPEIRVLVLTTSTSSDGIAQALEAGATGALLKSAELDELRTAIRNVAAGTRYISDEIAQIMTKDPPLPELTPRQLEILKSITRGFSNPDIARQLGISVQMVKEHMTALLLKIGAANRTEAVAIALRKHLLKI